jgi:hypothetical protein
MCFVCVSDVLYFVSGGSSSVSFSALAHTEQASTDVCYEQQQMFAGPPTLAGAAEVYSNNSLSHSLSLRLSLSRSLALSLSLSPSLSLSLVCVCVCVCVCKRFL